MAEYKYIGSLAPTKHGDYKIVLMGSRGRRVVTFSPGETIEVTDEMECSQLEYSMDSWTKEFDYVRVG